MLYVRFPLSLRNVEDLLHERGIDVSHETVRFWWNCFGPIFAAEIRGKQAQQLRAWGIVTLTGFTANFSNPPVVTLCGFNGLANAGERRNRPILD